ncbi:MAG TPA: 16S rRNA (cytosine(1402)-N(4))-methyltransferase RsmH [Thermoanaerobaculia bacterium]|nr:16S rRNA (cytosine(1402)-N(4))-methyltransferase RsmH [Thermoanaerobaculia bacterium]
MHQSVLFNEVVEFLRPARADGTLVDATLGLGGHAEGLLERYPAAGVLGIDRDPRALELARERLGRFGNRVAFVQGRHEQLIEILRQSGIDTASGVLADLGVSSMQLDDVSRGFSFRHDAPLDMRMGPDSRSAAEIVNTTSAEELARILRQYGEEPMARRIAHAIVNARPVETTVQLAEIVRGVKRAKKPHSVDPATLTFQAIRIAANEELVGLERFVDDAVSVLEPGARIAVIAFHSLEDRIVKRALRRLEGECTCPPALPVCACGAKEVVTVLTSRPVTASEEEIQRNPRSRSAKLRVAEKK